MYLLQGKMGTLLSVVLFIVIMTVVVGCSDSITRNESDINQSNIQHRQSGYSYDYDVDELWVIDNSDCRSEVTIEEVQQILEENSDIYTIDDEVDVDLLRQFVVETFDPVEIVTDLDDIIEILSKTKTNSTIDKKTGSYSVIIKTKNK